MPERKEREKEAEIPVFGASGRKVGDYLLGQMIGAGSMGSVFLAKQISTQSLAAVKILRSDRSADPLYVERFFQEVRLLASLDDPHAVRVIEAGMDGRTCFFAMEYVDGRDLRTELAIQDRLTEKEVLRTARDIARLMAGVWKKYKMVHRDIKPANIMRTRTGTTKLLGLGISGIAAPAENRSGRTVPGLLTGPPVYASPELVRGNREIDFRSDIYSLGITMYHLLAGHPPYNSQNSMSVVNMHLTSPIPVLQNETAITPGTSTLIREMMCKDPGGRPGSWEEIERRTVRLLGQFDTVPSPLLQDGGKDRGGLLRGKMLFVCVTILLISVLLLSTAIVLAIRKKRMSADGRAPVSTVKTVVPSSKKKGKTADPAAEQRKMEMSILLRLSGERETAGDFAGAIRLWKNYHPPAELRNDPELRRCVKEQIRYLEERLQEQRTDALP